MSIPAGKPLQAAIRPVEGRATMRRPGRGDAGSHEAGGDDRLWGYYEQIGEIHYWLQTQQSIASVLNYFPAVDTDDTDTEDPDPDTDTNILALWDGFGGEEQLREWVGELSIHLKVTGKAYLAALDNEGNLIPTDREDDDRTTLIWDVMSTSEFARKVGTGDPGKVLAWKIWARHPRDARQADSPLNVLARQCETLVTLDARMLADARSRLFAGITLLPDTLLRAVTQSGETWDQMIEDTFLEPIRDPDAVSSVMPVFGYVPAELLGKAQQITFGREDISLASAQREELIRRIAAGLDAPAEYLLGMGDVNHWTAWLINDDAFDRHVGPTVHAILRDLSTWWRAQVEAAGYDSTDRMIYLDPTPALRRADQLADTIQTFDRYGASWEALRRAAGLDDDDAPSEEEIEQRLRINQLSSPLALAQLAEGNDPGTPDVDAEGVPATDNPADDGAEPPPPPDTATYHPPQERKVRPAWIIAAADDRTERLAADLARLDRETLTLMEAEAEQQISRAMDSAHDRIVDAAGGPAVSNYASLDGDDIISLVGADAGVDPDDFDPERLARIIEEAEAGRISILTGSELIEGEPARMGDDDRNTAVTAIVGALLAAAIAATLRSRPDPDQPDIETTGRTTEPPVGDIRRALTVAGGASPADADADPAVDMIGNGQRTIDTLAAAGLVNVGYRWLYGDIPRRTFRPHADIDGQFFEDFDDPALTPPSHASWVGPRMFPGDHRGCRCTYRRVLEVAEPAA